MAAQPCLTALQRLGQHMRAVESSAGPGWVDTHAEGKFHLGINHGEDIVSVTTQNRSALPAADMQWRARKIAMQASKLADQAGPVSRKAAMTARQGAGGAAGWAKPRVGRVRAWMAVRAAKSSVTVQEKVAPRVSLMLTAAARRLDPPKPRARRWPKVFAGTALLAAGAAAATAIAMRNRANAAAQPVLPRKPAAGSSADQQSRITSQASSAQRPMTESDVNGLSRSR